MPFASMAGCVEATTQWSEESTKHTRSLNKLVTPASVSPVSQPATSQSSRSNSQHGECGLVDWGSLPLDSHSWVRTTYASVHYQSYRTWAIRRRHNPKIFFPATAIHRAWLQAQRKTLDDVWCVCAYAVGIHPFPVLAFQCLLLGTRS